VARKVEHERSNSKVKVGGGRGGCSESRTIKLTI